MKFLNFLPREDLFYELIETLTAQAHDSAIALHGFVETGDELAFQKIVVARENAKRALRTLVEEICRTFITPFDREDLQELAEALYRISATIGTISQRMKTHGLHTQEGDFQRMTQICAHQADHLVVLMKGLNKNEKPSILQELVALLYDLEDQGDNISLELEDKLFSRSPMPTGRDLFIRKDLYHDLEHVTDAFRDAAAIALRIILKHS